MTFAVFPSCFLVWLGMLLDRPNELLLLGVEMGYSRLPGSLPRHWLGLAHVAHWSVGISVPDSDLIQLFSVAPIALFLFQYSFLTKLSGEKANNIAKINRKIVIATDVFKSIMSTNAVMMNGAFCSYIQCCFECTTKI